MSAAHKVSLVVIVVFVLGLVGCSQGARVDPAPRWNGSVVVRLLPEEPVVDMAKQALPPLPGAAVQVKELSLKATTDKDGVVRLSLPLGRTEGFGPDEGVYTIIVTSPKYKFQTTVKLRLTKEQPQFEIHYNTQLNVSQDYATTPAR